MSVTNITQRCLWCQGDPLYVNYHDKERGSPVYNDALLFEYLLLESFQAGLSWIIILRKREHFRQAFDGFNYERIAHYNQNKIDQLMANEKTVRHRLKIKAAVSNAQAFIEVQKQFKPKLCIRKSITC